TSGCTAGTTFDDDADVARAANRAGLVQRQSHPGHVELVEHNLGDALGKRLDQLKLTGLDEGDQAFGDGLVVQSVVDGVVVGRLDDVGGHSQVQTDGLLDATFPVVDADEGVDAQIAQKDDVHPDKIQGARDKRQVKTSSPLVSSLWALVS